MRDPDDCPACEALLKPDGTCSNNDCWTLACLQCGAKRCDCPPLTGAEKMALRGERDRKQLNQSLTRAANERLYPKRPRLPSETQFQAGLARRPKVTLSERRARSAAQYDAKVFKE